MRQQVVVTTDAAVELKPLLQSAIRSELRLLDLGLERTRQRLQAFEARYDMPSDEFQRRFEAGVVGEDLDAIEWAGELETLRRLQTQSAALDSAELH